MNKYGEVPDTGSASGNGDAAAAFPRRERVGSVKRVWIVLRKRLVGSSAFKSALVWSLAHGLRFINLTNPMLAGSRERVVEQSQYAPAIAALWHGQHIMGPFIKPDDIDMVALFSRSADAELNAQVAQKLGFGIVRGSGGRANTSQTEKGGARALIALKKALDAGKSVAMIADIPHGTPREAGLGIVMLARLSGRPVVPAAYASSRRKVLEKTWDKTVINLPFGRAAVALGEPIFVDRDADDAEMERKRREVTDALNAVTAQAYAMVDGKR